MNDDRRIAMDETRYRVKSPSLAIHERAREIAQQSRSLVLDNPRRLSLSVRNPTRELLNQLSRAGATVSKEARYDLEVTQP